MLAGRALLVCRTRASLPEFPVRLLPAASLALLALPSFAMAQSNTEDLEYRESELQKQKNKLEVRGGFEAQWHEYDNLDLRQIDETSDQAILDSDDRNSFAFTGVQVELGYKVDPKTRFVVGASHRGLWGNDQIGNVNRFGGMLYFTSLYVDYAPMGLKKSAIRFRVGREYFSLGGLGGAKDYILADVVDQLRITVNTGEAGRFELIPVTVVGSSSENDNANFVSYIGQNTTQTFGFRGDHMTRRFGGMYVMDGVEGLDTRVYAFYTDIGALGSGSDISYNGSLGNFSDNDWSANAGVRVSYTINEVVTPFASFDLSRGIDRKEEVAQDITNDGKAIYAGVVIDTRDKEGTGLEFETSFFTADGATYDADTALQTGHGFVGMKARQVGGTITDRFMGWHPTAYVGMFGISDNPQDISRKSGTRVMHASAGYTLPFGLGLGVGWWQMRDTGSTGFDLNTLTSINPPFGYSREEFAAQDRLGKLLGQEIDVDISQQLSESLTFTVNGAMFTPGEFYEIPIARVAGDALGGKPQNAWAVNAGTRLRF